MKDDVPCKIFGFVTRILAGIINAHIFDDNFIPAGRCVCRNSPRKMAGDIPSGEQNLGKVKPRTDEVPPDHRLGVPFTTELDRCPGQHRQVRWRSRTYCACSAYAI